MISELVSKLEVLKGQSVSSVYKNKDICFVVFDSSIYIFNCEGILKEVYENISVQLTNEGDFVENQLNGVIVRDRETERFGYIGQNGRLCLDTEYNRFYIEHDIERICFCSSGHSVVIDLKGEIVQPTFRGIVMFAESKKNVKIVKVLTEKYEIKKYLVDRSYKRISKLYDVIYFNRLNSIMVNEGNKSGLLDSTGREVYDCRYDSIVCFPKDETSVFLQEVNIGGRLVKFCLSRSTDKPYYVFTEGSKYFLVDEQFRIITDIYDWRKHIDIDKCEIRQTFSSTFRLYYLRVEDIEGFCKNRC